MFDRCYEIQGVEPRNTPVAGTVTAVKHVESRREHVMWGQEESVLAVTLIALRHVMWGQEESVVAVTLIAIRNVMWGQEEDVMSFTLLAIRHVNCILFDGENISFEASLVLYIYI